MSKESDSATNRLSDMIVEEVSLVDRAANKRRFLVVKQAGAPMGAGAEVVPVSGGMFTTTDKAKPPPTDDPDSEKKPAQPEKAALVLAPDTKSMLNSILQDAMTQLAQLAESVANAEESADAPPEPPPELSQAIEGVATMLSDCCASPESDASATGDAGVAATTEPSLGAAAPVTMRWAQVLTAKRDFRAVLSKFGAKMSKDRYTRFQQAMTVLQSIMSELAPQVAAEQAAAAAGTPSGGVDKGCAAGKKPLQKADDASTRIAELTALVRAQGRELDRIKKTRTESNALPVESSSRPATNHVSWPQDMNRPQNLTPGDDSFA